MFFPSVFLLNVEASYKLIKFQRLYKVIGNLIKVSQDTTGVSLMFVRNLTSRLHSYNIHVVTTMVERAFEQAWGPIWNRNGEGQKKKKKPVNVRHWIQTRSNNHKRHRKKKKQRTKRNNNNKNIQAALLRRHTYRIIKLNYFFHIKTYFFFPSETGSHISGH